MKMTRRELLAAMTASAGVFGPVSFFDPHAAWGQNSRPSAGTVTGWDTVPRILARIVAPAFPSRDFRVIAYGAKGDGTSDCSEAFTRAIDACSAAGGGRVVVPDGRFLTGAIHLRSNVNLHLTSGATIAFRRDPAAYLPAVRTWFEGMQLMNYSPLIYAYQQQNVAVTGDGTLDGQANADYWWPWKGTPGFGWKSGTPNQLDARARLYSMMEHNVPVERRTFGEGDYMRPAFIETHSCRNVLIEGVRIIHSPMWELHPVLSQNVTIRNVTISTLGPNNDGCDPESCRDVLIDGCEFNTGDDCIAIKSGRNQDGRRLNTPSENIIVRNCRMLDGHGGVTLGSEISGGVRNVFIEKNTMDSARLDRALRLKNNAARGGLLEHIYMRDCVVRQVAEAILAIDFYYEEGVSGAFEPVVRDVELRNISGGRSQYVLYLRGIPKSEISDIRVIDSSFENVEKANVTENVKGVDLRNVRMNGSVSPSKQ
jgi:polygalacturonase